MMKILLSTIFIILNFFNSFNNESKLFITASTEISYPACNSQCSGCIYPANQDGTCSKLGNDTFSYYGPSQCSELNPTGKLIYCVSCKLMNNSIVEDHSSFSELLRTGNLSILHNIYCNGNIY